MDVGCEPKNVDRPPHLSNYGKTASRSIRSVKYFASLKNDDLTIRFQNDHFAFDLAVYISILVYSLSGPLKILTNERLSRLSNHPQE